MINLNYLPDGGTGHMIPSKEATDFWRLVHELTNFKSLMEIGFNAGHSSAFMLTLFEDIWITSYDICMFDVTKQNAEIVKEKFGDRFDFVEADSMDLDPEDIKGKYDIIFIDGSHELEYVENDIQLAFEAKIPYVVFDDLQNDNVREVYGRYIDKKMVDIGSGRYKASTGKIVPAKLCRVIL